MGTNNILVFSKRANNILVKIETSIHRLEESTIVLKLCINILYCIQCITILDNCIAVSIYCIASNILQFITNIFAHPWNSGVNLKYRYTELVPPRVDHLDVVGRLFTPSMNGIQEFATLLTHEPGQGRRTGTCARAIVTYYSNNGSDSAKMVPILRDSPRWHGTGTIFVIYLRIGISFVISLNFHNLFVDDYRDL
jgi:hypothetical protein